MVLLFQGTHDANVAITGSSEKQIADLHTTPIFWGLFESEKEKKAEDEEKGISVQHKLVVT